MPEIHVAEVERRLEQFVEESGGITGAAERLKMSRQFLHRAISDPEKLTPRILKAIGVKRQRFVKFVVA